MMKKKNLLFLVLAFVTLPFYAAKVDTVLVKSPSMNKDIKVVIVTPDIAIGNKAKACPTVYLLHGYSGNAETWVKIKPNLPEIADEKGIIFVCPDGKNSWYWDCPKNKDFKYETFISSELINYIDNNYNTIPNKNNRAITGLSMGGHGALFNAMRHKDIFGAAGSTSGGVDIRPFPQNWDMNKHLGEMAANKQSWDEHTVINQINKINTGDLALIIDCGEGDFFLEVNKNLHNRLLARGIDHDFILRPGVHNNQYWKNSIDYQILFFSKYFNQ